MDENKPPVTPLKKLLLASGVRVDHSRGLNAPFRSPMITNKTHNSTPTPVRNENKRKNLPVASSVRADHSRGLNSPFRSPVITNTTPSRSERGVRVGLSRNVRSPFADRKKESYEISCTTTGGDDTDGNKRDDGKKVNCTTARGDGTDGNRRDDGKKVSCTTTETSANKRLDSGIRIGLSRNVRNRNWCPFVGGKKESPATNCKSITAATIKSETNVSKADEKYSIKNDITAVTIKRKTEQDGDVGELDKESVAAVDNQEDFCETQATEDVGKEELKQKLEVCTSAERREKLVVDELGSDADGIIRLVSDEVKEKTGGVKGKRGRKRKLPLDKEDFVKSTDNEKKITPAEVRGNCAVENFGNEKEISEKGISSDCTILKQSEDLKLVVNLTQLKVDLPGRRGRPLKAGNEKCSPDADLQIKNKQWAEDVGSGKKITPPEERENCAVEDFGNEKKIRDPEERESCAVEDFGNKKKISEMGISSECTALKQSEDLKLVVNLTQLKVDLPRRRGRPSKAGNEKCSPDADLQIKNEKRAEDEDFIGAEEDSNSTTLGVARRPRRKGNNFASRTKTKLTDCIDSDEEIKRDDDDDDFVKTSNSTKRSRRGKDSRKKSQMMDDDGSAISVAGAKVGETSKTDVKSDEGAEKCDGDGLTKISRKKFKSATNDNGEVSKIKAKIIQTERIDEDSTVKKITGKMMNDGEVSKIKAKIIQNDENKSRVSKITGKTMKIIQGRQVEAENNNVGDGGITVEEENNPGVAGVDGDGENNDPEVVGAISGEENTPGTVGVDSDEENKNPEIVSGISGGENNSGIVGVDSEEENNKPEVVGVIFGEEKNPRVIGINSDREIKNLEVAGMKNSLRFAGEENKTLEVAGVIVDEKYANPDVDSAFGEAVRVADAFEGNKNPPVVAKENPEVAGVFGNQNDEHARVADVFEGDTNPPAIAEENPEVAGVFGNQKGEHGRVADVFEGNTNPPVVAEENPEVAGAFGNQGGEHARVADAFEGNTNPPVVGEENPEVNREDNHAGRIIQRIDFNNDDSNLLAKYGTALLADDDDDFAESPGVKVIRQKPKKKKKKSNGRIKRICVEPDNESGTNELKSSQEESNVATVVSSEGKKKRSRRRLISSSDEETAGGGKYPMKNHKSNDSFSSNGSGSDAVKTFKRRTLSLKRRLSSAVITDDEDDFERKPLPVLVSEGGGSDCSMKSSQEIEVEGCNVQSTQFSGNKLLDEDDDLADFQTPVRKNKRSGLVKKKSKNQEKGIQKIQNVEFISCNEKQLPESNSERIIAEKITSRETETVANDLNALRDEVYSLEVSVYEKENRVEELKRAVHYKQKHDITDLNRRTGVWKNGCKQALDQLLDKLRENMPTMTLQSLLARLGVPPEFVDFDEANDCFK